MTKLQVFALASSGVQVNGVHTTTTNRVHPNPPTEEHVEHSSGKSFPLFDDKTITEPYTLEDHPGLPSKSFTYCADGVIYNHKLLSKECFSYNHVTKVVSPGKSDEKSKDTLVLGDPTSAWSFSDYFVKETKYVMIVHEFTKKQLSLANMSVPKTNTPSSKEFVLLDELKHGVSSTPSPDKVNVALYARKTCIKLKKASWKFMSPKSIFVCEPLGVTIDKALFKNTSFIEDKRQQNALIDSKAIADAALHMSKRELQRQKNDVENYRKAQESERLEKAAVQIDAENKKRDHEQDVAAANEEAANNPLNGWTRQQLEELDTKLVENREDKQNKRYTSSGKGGF